MLTDILQHKIDIYIGPELVAAVTWQILNHLSFLLYSQIMALVAVFLQCRLGQVLFMLFCRFIHRGLFCESLFLVCFVYKHM